MGGWDNVDYLPTNYKISSCHRETSHLMVFGRPWHHCHFPFCFLLPPSHFTLSPPASTSHRALYLRVRACVRKVLKCPCPLTRRTLTCGNSDVETTRVQSDLRADGVSKSAAQDKETVVVGRRALGASRWQHRWHSTDDTS